MGIPRIEREWIKNIRNVNENELIIIPKLVYNNEQINLNGTAKTMFELVDGKTDLKEIVEKITALYDGVVYEDVYSDALELYMTLWKLGILAWDENPCAEQYKKDVGDCTIEFVSVDCVKAFLAIVNDHQVEYVTPFRYKKYIVTDFDIKQAIVNASNQYFVIKRRGREIAALVARIDIKEVSFVIDYLSCRDEFFEVDDSIIRDVLAFVRETIVGLLRGYIPKEIEIYGWEVAVSDNDKFWLEYMDEKEYFKKVLLKEECIDGDVIIYYFR